MKTRCYLIDDYRHPLGPDATSETIRNHPEARRRIFQFTSLLYNPKVGKLYCGVTNFDSDILHLFDPQTKAVPEPGVPGPVSPPQPF